jgi:hypothetical protein
MTQSVVCPNCGATGHLPEGALGAALRCARCHSVFPNRPPPRLPRLNRKVLLVVAGVAILALVVYLVVRLLLPVTPAERIVGTWQRMLPDGTTVEMYFAPDGTLTIKAMGARARGTYRFLTRDSLEIQVTGTAVPGATVGKVRAEFPAPNVLDLIYDSGIRHEWQRVD